MKYRKRTELKLVGKQRFGFGGVWPVAIAIFASEHSTIRRFDAMNYSTHSAVTQYCCARQVVFCLMIYERIGNV